MIRTLTIVAAAAALLLPAGHYIDDALGTGVKSGYAVGASVKTLATTAVPHQGTGAQAKPKGKRIVSQDNPEQY